MSIEFIQIVVILIIIIVFGVIITFVNLKKKIGAPVTKEQESWNKIETLNSKKKEMIKKKEELTFKYAAKTMDENSYTNNLKYLNADIKKVDAEINQEILGLTKLQSTNDSDENIRFSNIKLKGNLGELKTENEGLKQKINELEGFIKNLSNSEGQENSTSNKQAKEKYYELILEKYRDIINDDERKTISEIKEMIKPDDLTVKSIISKHKPIGYDFNKDYLATLRKIYNYLKSDVTVIKNDLKLLFWNDFTSIIKNKIADEQDISILQCSIMQALGDKEAHVCVVMLEQDNTHAFVKTKYKSQYYIFDLAQKVPFDIFKNTDENKLLSSYKYDNKNIIKQIYNYNQYDYFDYRT